MVPSSVLECNVRQGRAGQPKGEPLFAASRTRPRVLRPGGSLPQGLPWALPQALAFVCMAGLAVGLAAFHQRRPARQDTSPASPSLTEPRTRVDPSQRPGRCRRLMRSPAFRREALLEVRDAADASGSYSYVPVANADLDGSPSA